MKNKQLCWAHAYETHFAARRRLAGCAVNMPLPSGNGIDFSFLLAGRIVVLISIMTFIVTYLYGISQYGWKLGMAVGWLPSIMLAWLTAQMLAFVIRSAQNKEISLLQYRLQFSSIHTPFCCRGRTKTSRHYWKRN